MASVSRLFTNVADYFRRPPSPSERAVTSGKRPSDIPQFRIKKVALPVLARLTGPEEGLCGAHGSVVDKQKCAHCNENWGVQDERRMFGMALSLYDAAKDHRQAHSGDPVADVFGLVAYRNGGLLCVADGVNWGEKSRLAARCAVHNSLEYLIKTLDQANSTQEVIAHILRSFDSAQKMIIQREATMTTLVTACVCHLEDGRWGLCVVNVGDSLMYVFTPSTGVVREVTGASHEDTRDVREAGGALGPSDGYSPDLGNLTCSFTFLEPGDIVFGVTDGVSDNFDPVILKKARADVVRGNARMDTSLEILTQADRDEAVQLRMAAALKEERPAGELPNTNSSSLTQALLRHVVNQSEEKRRCLEEANMVQDNMDKERELISKSRRLPGKLDHATVAAFQVGLKVPPTPEQVQQCHRLEQELGNL